MAQNIRLHLKGSEQQLCKNQVDVSLTLAKHLLLNNGKDSNLVFSPISIQVVLSLVAAGSSGKTLEQLLCFLKAESIDQLNSVYARLVNVVFADGLFTYWFSAAEEVRNLVNSWVQDETRGLIKDILAPDSLDSSTQLILANALYFKGKRSCPFNASYTKHFDFHLLHSTSVQVPFMTSKKKQFISVFDGFKVLKLPYEQARNHQYWEEKHSFSMYIFFEVDEKGTEAAAATGVYMIDGCSMSRPIEIVIDFVADHPFLFVIRENSTGMVQFIGHVLNPSASS